MKKTLTIAATVIALAGCNSYNNARGKGDAPVGAVSDSPWNIENAPDGFGNVATKCSSHVKGVRLWIVTHGNTDVQPVITLDESCR
jgi:hypothetical protein